ncbi:MAG: hypothetical protein JW849_02780 [Phycisphaerae bacterium]|nr:hypothetical protein [Phycisphaerae bacterium]
MPMNMTDTQQNSREHIPFSRVITAGLLVWMLGVMLLGWFVLDGPGVSSLAKRVAPLKRAQRTLRCALGEPAEGVSPADEGSQP